MEEDPRNSRTRCRRRGEAQCGDMQRTEAVICVTETTIRRQQSTSWRMSRPQQPEWWHQGSQTRIRCSAAPTSDPPTNRQRPRERRSSTGAQTRSSGMCTTWRSLTSKTRQDRRTALPNGWEVSAISGPTWHWRAGASLGSSSPVRYSRGGTTTSIRTKNRGCSGSTGGAPAGSAQGSATRS